MQSFLDAIINFLKSLTLLKMDLGLHMDSNFDFVPCKAIIVQLLFMLILITFSIQSISNYRQMTSITQFHSELLKQDSEVRHPSLPSFPLEITIDNDDEERYGMEIYHCEDIDIFIQQ